MTKNIRNWIKFFWKWTFFGKFYEIGRFRTISQRKKIRKNIEPCIHRKLFFLIFPWSEDFIILMIFGSGNYEILFSPSAYARRGLKYKLDFSSCFDLSSAKIQDEKSNFLGPNMLQQNWPFIISKNNKKF